MYRLCYCVGTNEGLKPIILYWFFRVIIFFHLFFLFSQEMLNSFKIFVSEISEASSNVEYFLEVRFISLSIVNFDFGDLPFKLFVKFSLLNKKVIDSNSLNFFGERSQFFDLVLDLLFNSNLILFVIVVFMLAFAIFSTHFQQSIWYYKQVISIVIQIVYAIYQL